MHNRWACFSMLFLLSTTLGLRGEVVNAEPEFFEVGFEGTLAASPEAVFETFEAIGSWWNPSHTFGGRAENYRFEQHERALLENLETGWAKHMEIAYWNKPRQVVLKGGLGPLMMLPVNGVMVWTFTETDEGTAIRLNYKVAGHSAGEQGLKVWAGPVNEVLQEQFNALLASVTKTGR